MIKKKDAILIGVILILTILSLFVLKFQNKGGSQVVITLDGTEYGTYSLSENKFIYIPVGDGSNTVQIKDGTVCMTEATCPDQICVHTYPISLDQPGAIVCLPHKMVVEIR